MTAAEHVNAIAREMEERRAVGGATMIDECINIGDKVTITIEKENREWGYNPCPDGTIAEVTGFSEINYGRVNDCMPKPGVYVDRSWVKLKLEDGKEHTEWSSRLTLLDQKEYKKRETAFHKNVKENPDYFRKREFIRDLPETPFWEGDKVKVRDQFGNLKHNNGDIFTIIRIDYNHLDQKRNDGSEYPAYNISDSFEAGWHRSASAEEINLVVRGNVWKYYHNEPIKFADLREEANFATRLGLCKEVRNPANKLYSWTLEEVLQAIRDGIVHGFTMSSIFGGSPRINAQFFVNEELGKRVAASTLEGFITVGVNFIKQMGYMEPPEGRWIFQYPKGEV